MEDLPVGLPSDLREELAILEQELEDGDITQKGYDKKKAALLQPYLKPPGPSITTDDATKPLTSPPIVTRTFRPTEGEYYHQQPRSQSTFLDKEDEDYQLSTDDACLDLGPEPSAADHVDFLDFLPSPTHSPPRSASPEALMEHNHQQVIQQQQQQQQRSPQPSILTESPRQQHQPLPPRPTGQPAYRPLPPQHQHHPQQHPPQWNQSYPSTRPRPPYDYRMVNRPQYGMGPPPPTHHSGGGGYPGQRPPLPHQVNGSPGAMYRPQGYSPGGRPPPPHMYGGSPAPRPPYYRPSPPSQQQQQQQQQTASSVAPGSPMPMRPSSAIGSRHTRTSSMESGAFSVDRSQMSHVARQSSDYVDASLEPISPNGGLRRPDADWDTASVNGGWRPTPGRDPSIMSSSTRKGTHSSSLYPLRRPDYRNRGRSRYGDSYMATSFKAIEPAPVSLLRLDDPNEQMLLADLAGRQMRPLQPRSIPFPVLDSVGGKNQQNLASFENLAAILRYRATNDSHRHATAFTAVDSKGKEPVTISWDKLNARAEKVAATIRDKSGLQLGDRVALIYRKSEVLDFIVALFGCFLAGMVAIPINAADDLSELSFILNLTSANLVLTTDFNHKAFIKDMQTRSMEIPSNVEWWKTNDFGTWYPTKKIKDYPAIKVPELAYIEYAKAVNGELKGVTVTHQTIMAEGRMYKASVTETDVTVGDTDGALNVAPKARPQHSGFDTVVSYLEPRQQVGMVLSVLCSVYCGNHTVFTSGSIVDTPAVWIYVLSKYRATIALSDYPALNNITKYYQQNTKEVLNHSKKVAPDLSSLRYLFIDSCVSKPDLNQYIADKLLRPLGSTDDPERVVCPVASLAEHGGMLLSFRDNLGPAHLDGFGNGQERLSALAEGQSSDVWECLLDAEALKMKKVVVVAAGEGARKARTDCHEILVSSFGFVIPEATVAIVDPDTTTLCPPDTIGEVWIDAPSISGGFWALPRHSEAIFHAKPTIVPPDTMYPEVYNQEFLRTGLIGTLIGGRLVIFGNYEDRIRQQVFGEPQGVEEVYFANDVLDIIQSRTLNDKCTVFDITVNNQHLPVVACESSAPRSDLAGMTAEIEESLLELLGIRLFAVVVVANGALPKQLKHGRRQIHALITKRAFLTGQLTIRHTRLDVDRTIFNLPTNDDSGQQSLWRSGLAYDRAIRQRAIMPNYQQQHTGMETVRAVTDERTDFDLSKFTSIVDVLQWRTAIHPEETAFVGLSHNGSGTVETKPYTWRKINYTIASAATYMIKRGLKRGRKALVIVPFGVDWILAIYACLVVGVTPIPVDVPDPQQQQAQRIKDDVEVVLTTARDLNVTYVIVNNASENILKNKPVNPAMRQLLTSTFKGYKLPDFTNISKAPKHHKLLGKESGMAIQPEWLSSNNTTAPLILSQVGADGKRLYPTLRHETILQQCRAQKTTCQMKWQRGIVATGLGASDNLGLLHSTFCGVYVGCITVMVPTEDFYLDPFSFFEMVQRYKAKDICVTSPLMQYAMNRMGPTNEQRRLALHNVQNIMMVTEGRPRPIFYQNLARFFSLHRLEKEALNTTYSHIANPMVTTRSYMLVEPITLIADLYWLRRGIVRSLPLEEESRGIVLNDSGIVPSNTMVAIVNPETLTLCPSSVVGEIWVSSDSTVKNLLTDGKTGDDVGASALEVTLPGADPRIKYMRTGDLGFLWNVQRRGNMMEQMMEEGQCLYVLGPKCEILERSGLMHFPGDVETSIERCHSAIPANGSIVIQHGKEIIAIVAVKSKEHATSATPLIVSTVLENHSFLVDTVVIVLPTSLPRSRFGEKQRDKTLSAYVEKKLSTVYVKRITNQHEPLHLQWEQSQFSNDNNDAMSLRTSHTRPVSTRASSIAETTHESDPRYLSSTSDDGLARNDTVGSRHSSQLNMTASSSPSSPS